LGKTSIELRRAINRLSLFKEQNTDDPHIPAVDALIKELYEARSHIPRELRDPDIEAKKD
jgi:hypothetical protein